MQTRFHTLAALAVAAITISANAWGQATPATTVQQYLQTNLVADSTATAPNAKTIDPNLQGGWGMSQSSTGPWWISDFNNGLSTLYTGAGVTESLVVTIPPADPSKSKTGTPTGMVFNENAAAFLLSDGKAASFLFATADGLITGWNGSVSANTAEIAVNQNSTSEFFALAVAQAKVDGVEQMLLYATDLKGRAVDVFNAQFQHVASVEHAIANIGLPAGYAPYGITNMGGTLYVTIVRTNAAGTDQQDSPNNGLVAAITPEGKLISTLETGNFLESPWAVALAPSDFGQYSHDLLVSNNGSGVIDAFNPVTGKFLGKLKDANNNVIKINGIWGIAFGSGTTSGGPSTSLYFAAQPSTGGGLFGTLTPVQNTFGSDN